MSVEQGSIVIYVSADFTDFAINQLTNVSINEIVYEGDAIREGLEDFVVEGTYDDIDVVIVRDVKNGVTDGGSIETLWGAVINLQADYIDFLEDEKKQKIIDWSNVIKNYFSILNYFGKSHG